MYTEKYHFTQFSWFGFRKMKRRMKARRKTQISLVLSASPLGDRRLTSTSHSRQSSVAAFYIVKI
jgi:hypothetical protein